MEETLRVKRGEEKKGEKDGSGATNHQRERLSYPVAKRQLSPLS